MIISKTNKDSYQIKIPSKIINIYNIEEIQKITIHTNNPFLYKLDYFDIIKDKKDKIYYYDNNFYLKINNKIKKRKYLDLLEKSEIIYQNTYQIINEGIKI